MKITIRRNVSKLQNLDELNVFDIQERYSKFGFIIVSSNRSCEAETGQETCSAEELEVQKKKNEFNNKLIRKDIRSAGFGFLPVFGGFKERVVDKDNNVTAKEVTEPAYIVVAKEIASKDKPGSVDKLYQLGLHLIKKYNQDSFLYSPPGDKKEAFYINKNEEVDMKFDGIKLNDMTKDFFTRLNNSQRRFTFTESVYFMSAPSDINESKKRYGEEFYRIDK